MKDRADVLEGAVSTQLCCFRSVLAQLWRPGPEMFGSYCQVTLHCRIRYPSIVRVMAPHVSHFTHASPPPVTHSVSQPPAALALWSAGSAGWYPENCWRSEELPGHCPTIPLWSARGSGR